MPKPSRPRPSGRAFSDASLAPPRPVDAPPDVVCVLVDGAEVWVDPETWARYADGSWRLHRRGYVTVRHHGVQEYLHRLVLAPPAGRMVHHLDGHRLHNWRANLVIARAAENAQARRRCAGSTSAFVGVWQDGERGDFRAEITTNGVRRTLGRHKTEEAAARARDEAVRRERAALFQKRNLD